MSERDNVLTDNALVISGSPSPPEVAAVAAALLTLHSASSPRGPESITSPRSTWGEPARMLRSPLPSPNPSAWYWSTRR
ncbi:MAG: acyl-CoA carboxylase epsilon subunit [Candidatus Nanopelagicales bacterium]|nr:acyl-CoA carboxylase epsilon subunit [Candidatus Nanopelagicales bacterium]